MKTVAYAVLFAFVLAGCNTLPTEATEQGSITKTVKKADGSTEIVANKSDYATYLDKVGEQKALFEMSCPVTGCIIGNLKVNAPSDGSKIAAPVVPETFGVAFVKGVFGLADKTLDKAAGAVPFLAGWKVLDKAFDAASGKSITTTTTDNSNRTLINDSANRSSTITTTTSTDNSNRSVNNSNNRNCQTGAPAGTTGQTGSSGPATC